MIFRKPYAILIKIFKPLHFLLTVMLVYTSLKFYNIYDFLSNYIKTGYYSFVADLPSLYINSWMYLALILTLITLVLLILLLTSKKKPTVLYWLLFVASMTSFLFLFKIRNTLALLEINDVEIRNIITSRDISVVLAVFLIILSIVTFARSLGLNIKKFEFQKDIKQLNIEAMDSEEFEVDVNIDKNDIQAKLKRFFRKTKYYVVENKKVFLILAIIAVLGLALGIYINKEIVNKIYEEETSIVVDDIGYKVLNTYVTTKDYQNNDISGNKYAYVVVKLEMLNNSKENISFDIENAFLKIKKMSYKADLTMYQSFIDLGIGYTKQSIKELNNATFIIVFKIDKADRNKKMYLKIPTTNNKKTVLLEPNIFNVITTNSKVLLNTELVTTESPLKDTTFKVLDYELSDSFKYSIGESKVMIVPKNLNGKNTILRLNSILKISNQIIINQITNKEFIDSFMSIEYIKDNEDYSVVFNDLTPKNHSENYVYLEVPMAMKNAEEINLIFVIRNQKYVYQIKG